MGIKCLHCTFVNRGNAKFCKDCGKPLELLCSECGLELKPGDKFCDQCGYELKLNFGSKIKEKVFMDIKARLQEKTDQLISKGDKLVEEKVYKTLEELRPNLRIWFEEKIGPLTQKALQDEETLRACFQIIYQLLPLPVRTIVREENFVNLCIKNKDRVVPTFDCDTSAKPEAIPEGQSKKREIAQ